MSIAAQQILLDIPEQREQKAKPQHGELKLSSVNRQQTVLAQICVEELLPADHKARAIEILVNVYFEVADRPHSARGRDRGGDEGTTAPGAARDARACRLHVEVEGPDRLNVDRPAVAGELAIVRKGLGRF